MTHRPVEDAAYPLDRATTQERTGDSSLWGRILALIKQDLEERRNKTSVASEFIERAALADLHAAAPDETRRLLV